MLPPTLRFYAKLFPDVFDTLGEGIGCDDQMVQTS
jgi:hypothetical protein